MALCRAAAVACILASFASGLEPQGPGKEHQQHVEPLPSSASARGPHSIIGGVIDDGIGSGGAAPLGAGDRDDGDVDVGGTGGARRRLLKRGKPAPARVPQPVPAVHTPAPKLKPLGEDCEPSGQVDMCTYVSSVMECTADDHFVQYLPTYHCTWRWGGRLSRAIILIGFLLWMFLLFYSLATVADKFLCPALETISDMLKLPPDIAGVTLLAFANGAPDVFTEVAAVTGGEHVDLHLAVASTVGAGMYISTVVLAVVVIIRPQVAEDRVALQRDAWSYFFGLVLLLIVLYDGLITLNEVALLVGYYAAYIVATVYTGRMVTAYKARMSVGAAWVGDGEGGPLSPGGGMAKGRKRADGGGAGAAAAAPPPPPLGDASAPGYHPFPPEVLEFLPDASDDEGGGEPEEVAGTWAWVLREVGMVESMPPWRKALAVGTGAVTLAMHATMPQVARGQVYNRRYAMAVSWAAPAIILGAIGVTPSTVGTHTFAYYFLGAGTLTYVYGITTLSASVPPGAPEPVSTTYTPAMAGIAFVMSIVWMDLLASELVALLHAGGHIFGLSQDFLGATVLAWGESISDLVANISVARSGKGAMAVAACFGGPLFNALMGMGMALGYQVSAVGPVPAEVSRAMVIMFSFSLTGIAIVAVGVPLGNGWRLDRKVGFALLALYITFNATFMLTELG